MIHTANPGTIRTAVKRRILWCYVFLFSDVLFLEICATCKIAFFAISAGGSSSRPSPRFGEAPGPAGGTFTLLGPAGAMELRGGAPGANQVAATHAHPSRSPHARTHTHAICIATRIPTSASLACHFPCRVPQSEAESLLPRPADAKAEIGPTAARRLPRPRTPHQPRHGQPHQACDCCPA